MDILLLPKKTIKQIAAFVDVKDLPAFAASCKTFAAVVKELYVLTEDCYTFENDIDKQDTSTIQMKITYMKNTISNQNAEVATKNSADDIRISFSTYKNVREIFVTKIGQKRGILYFKDIEILLPHYCGHIYVNKSMIGHKFTFVGHSDGGSRVRYFYSPCITRFAGDIRVSERFNIENIYGGDYHATVAYLFKIAAECKTIIANVSKKSATVDIIKNNNIKLFKSRFVSGRLNFFLDCGNLRELDLHIEFPPSQKKNCKISDEEAARLRDMFKVCGDLRVVNIEHRILPNVGKMAAQGIADYLKENGFKVADDFNYVDIITYGRIIVDISASRQIAAICGELYIHGDLYSDDFCKYIKFIIDLLNVPINMQEYKYITIKFGGEDYKIDKKDAGQFSAKRIADYFKYDGLHNKYSLREYFPFAE